MTTEYRIPRISFIVALPFRRNSRAIAIDDDVADERVHPNPWRFVLTAWASSRVLFLAAGFVGAHVAKQAYPVGLPREPSGLLNYWANWDGGWYSSIAVHGYAQTLWPASTNFFPIYPALIHVVTLLGLGPAISGVGISLAASLAAFYFLHELAFEYFGARAARAAVLSLAFFPTAFYLNAVYGESVFLAAAIGSIWAARVRGSFVLAAVLGCIAAGTRNVGVFLVLPLLHEWIRQRPRQGARGLVAIGLVPWGLLGYMFWLWRWTAHPLLFNTVARHTWGRKPANPVHTLSRAWDVAGDGAVYAVHPNRVLAARLANGSFNAMETYNLVFLALLALLLVFVLVRLPAGLALYATLAAVVPTLAPAAFSPLASVPRYVLSVFPVFMALGALLARSRALLRTWLVASAAFGVLLTVYFTSWRWVA
jgi:hypothetical protein